MPTFSDRSPLALISKPCHSVRMKQRIALIGLFLTVPLPMLASPGTVCSFHAVDVDDRSLTEEDLRGHVTILFYETKDGGANSRKLKDDMNSAYAVQPPALQAAMRRLGVVNAASAPTLLRPFVKTGIREASRREGVPLYIDWDGSVGEACGLKRPSGTTVALFDRKGRLRMLFDGATAQADTVIGEVARLVAEH